MVDVVELPPQRHVAPFPAPRVLAIGVDTTIEQHGPHLPLATDTIQTYAVLQRLAAENANVALGPALDYGHLTWGLPFGLSIDLTPALLGRYACGFVNALVDWCSPGALYLADVHGSQMHRSTIEDALRRSRCARGLFRWLHEPLAAFGSERGDMHAGGVETTLVAHIAPALVDPHWWPQRREELAAGEMTTAEAIALSGEMARFIARVETQSLNGIIGRIRNAETLDAAKLFQGMLDVARADVRALTGV